MPYTCVVLVKQVPDTKHITGEVMRPDGTVNRGALPAICNPEDLNALETALTIRDQHGGSVVVLTMGLPKAAEVLREALYRGADHTILLSDRRLAGADTLATAYALSRAIRRIGKVDIVLCGRQAIDGDTAQVGPQVAECLGIPQITYVQRIEALAGRRIQALRSTEEGYEYVESRLPILLTVLTTANTPRYPSARRLMRFKKARCPLELRGGDGAAPEECAALEAKGLLIPVWTVEDIDADPAQCGHSGSPTKVAHVESVKLLPADTKLIEPSMEGLRGLVRELVEDHTLG